MPMMRQAGAGLWIFSHISNINFAAADKEVVLTEGTVLRRLFKRSLDPTLGLTLATFNSDLFVISAQSDGRIRIWSATVI
jgi:hypothetical protein